MTFQPGFSSPFRRPFPHPGISSHDWWDIAPGHCVAAWKPIGAPDLATAKLDVAHGAYPLLGTSSFNTLAGLIGNGSSDYYETGIVVPSTEWSIVGRYADAANGGFLFGNILSEFFGFAPNQGGINYYMRFYRGLPFVTHVPTTYKNYGIVGLCGNECYFDDSLVGVFASPQSDNNTLYLLAQHYSAGHENHYAGSLAAMAIYDKHLTNAEYLLAYANLLTL